MMDIKEGILYMGMSVHQYDRNRAVEYAHKWAYGRNPAYYDFEYLGGDCTNFASEVIYVLLS